MMRWKQNFLRVLKKINLLSSINLIFNEAINGSEFKIPVVRGIGYGLFFLNEPWMTSLIKKLLDLKQGAFVDVGANIGQTLLFLKSVNNKTPYIGFEPNPKCNFYLSELIQLNWSDNVKIIPAGIFSFTGIASLYVNQNDKVDACASLLEKFRDLNNPEILLAPVIANGSLDFLLEERIAIIKIDVEGAELEVLDQLIGCIKKFRPFVVCEVLPAYSSNQWRLDRQKKIESILKELDYGITLIGDKFELLEQIPIEGNENESNFLFFPFEYQKQL
jgi:FkbM family methyltransferase